MRSSGLLDILPLGEGSIMTHDEFLEFLGVLGEVLIEGDASEDPDTDNHDGKPGVEEVQNRVRLVKVLDDPS